MVCYMFIKRKKYGYDVSGNGINIINILTTKIKRCSVQNSCAQEKALQI